MTLRQARPDIWSCNYGMLDSCHHSGKHRRNYALGNKCNIAHCKSTADKDAVQTRERPCSVRVDGCTKG